ncbi:hypothetical protein K503DRAFT_805560 [Rhizopogon vinicolor AM-OR11-026]|uniref:DRBM domain-containing protein n=1 Tax=Rhizopogon vinicolor AM-OR11-026 TaxID=1314800 RepID=A0A1B7MHG9_9AGAM|nr:hypothetical protein K503DRAFT_805560 [Rhizopogon vinicolor AM-OR11-026]
MSSQEHPRNLLNNLLQSIYRDPDALESHVRWEIWQSGSPSSPMWHATFYIDDMNYGHYSAPTKGVAQDEAARQAYNNLRREQMARRGY